MSDHRASCRCGQLALLARGEPVRVSICHCLACQQRSGSAFAVQARFAAAAVRVEGEHVEYLRQGDEGGRARFHFCPVCGATVFYTLDDDPDRIAVPVGAFADPAFPPPSVSVYEVRRHPWVGLPAQIARYD